jgi:TonB family protein
MRSLLLCGAAALALAAPGAAQPQAPRASARASAAPETGWETHVYELDRSIDPADMAAPDFGAPGRQLTRWRAAPGIAAADLPEDLRRRAFSAFVVVAVEVGEAGSVTGCRVLRPSGDPRLDRLACDRLSRLEGYLPLYVGPGRRAAARWTYAIGFETLESGSGASAFLPPSPSPPPPPPSPDRVGQWPRFDHDGSLRPVALPAIQSMFPAAARRHAGKVSLDLVTTREGGIVECRIGVGSGDPALDQAACGAARQLDLRYEWPNLYAGRVALPLQIVWNRAGGSHIRLPLRTRWQTRGSPMPRDPADSRTATQLESEQPLQLDLTGQDLAGVEPLYPRAPYAFLSIGTDVAGRIRQCAVLQPTRLPALDARLCRIARQRLRAAPRTDVFGDPVAATRRVYIGFPRAS